VGYAVPQQFGEFIKQLRQKIPNSDKAVWSVHCHNDLGMAVANSLAAVQIGGARQIECTINGLGERAGNTSLEEVVMAVKTRGDFFNLQVGIDTTHIVPTSRLVSQITGFVVQPNKAVVGANAFAHASGIHQDGVLKARNTYEIMRAEDVGWSTNKIVLGKLSGRSAFKQRLKEIGIELEGEEAYNKAFQRFKDLADKKADIFDEDLQALVTQEAGKSSEDHWRLVTMNQASGMGERPFARITVMEAGAEKKAESQGDGPVDATFKAIESLAKSGAELLLYSVNAVTTGTESQGEVTVRLSKGGRIVNGVGADTDIVVASAKAYISALNKLESKIERLNPQHQL
jgi:2-isopropylmalate synthase